MVGMRLADAYRQLEVAPAASEEALRRAYLDLTKVWHPDRFAHDPALHAKAQEKLKAINEAYDTIVSARARGESVPLEVPPRFTPAPRQMLRRYTSFAIACAAAGFFILLRRPSPGGLILAVILLVFAAFALVRIRRMLHP